MQQILNVINSFNITRDLHVTHKRFVTPNFQIWNLHYFIFDFQTGGSSYNTSISCSCLSVDWVMGDRCPSSPTAWMVQADSCPCSCPLHRCNSVIHLLSYTDMTTSPSFLGQTTSEYVCAKQPATIDSANLGQKAGALQRAAVDGMS